MTPTVAPVAPVASITPAVASITPPVVSITPAPIAPDDEEDFDKKIERRIDRHFRINVDGDDFSHVEDAAWVAVPIVLIVFASLVAVPVLLVSAILYFANSRNRNLHKTVRMMVEKGQPVPEALLNPPPIVRQRSDLRRGVVLCVVGAGLMVFFGAVNDWEGGVWSLGFIPFIIGLGYLLVWKLDTHKEQASTASTPRL